jgi:hypothetical protein
MTSCDAITSGYDGEVDHKNGTNWTYTAYGYYSGYPRVLITTIASASRRSMYGPAPDGQWVGTLTSYCNDKSTQLCPDRVP